MKMLCHANDRFEANLISDTLTTHGIFSRIKFDEQGYMKSGTEFGEGLEVHVRDEDWNEAYRILHEKSQAAARH